MQIRPHDPNRIVKQFCAPRGRLSGAPKSFLPDVEPGHPPVCCEPEGAVLVLGHRDDGVIAGVERVACTADEALEGSRLSIEPVQPPSPGPEPHHPRLVFENRHDAVIAQARRIGGVVAIMDRPAGFPVDRVEPAVRTDPEDTLAVGVDGPDLVIAERILFPGTMSVILKFLPVTAILVQSPFRAEPDDPSRIIDRHDRVVAQRLRVLGPALDVPEAILFRVIKLHSLVGPRPEGACLILEDAENIVRVDAPGIAAERVALEFPRPAVEPVESVAGPDPEVPPPVFQHALDNVMAQAGLKPGGVPVPGPDSTRPVELREPFSPRADPDLSFPVPRDRKHSRGTRPPPGGRLPPHRRPPPPGGLKTVQLSAKRSDEQAPVRIFADRGNKLACRTPAGAGGGTKRPKPAPSRVELVQPVLRPDP